MSAKHWNRLSRERELWEQGLTCVAGVDEAGCGPLAGPVVAAAVVFLTSPMTSWLTGEVLDLNGGAHLKRYPNIHEHLEKLLGDAL